MLFRFRAAKLITALNKAENDPGRRQERGAEATLQREEVAALQRALAAEAEAKGRAADTAAHLRAQVQARWA